MPVADLVRSALADALALLLPVECVGCGTVDVALCEPCRQRLLPSVATRTIDGLVVRTGGVFEGVMARVVRSVKEEGRTSLASALAPALRAAAAAAGEVDAVVAVPSSRAAFRRRGFRPVEVVARRAGLRTARSLRVVRATADQRGLDRGARRRNVAGSLRAVGVGGLRVLVVDDVLTTGATLSEAARALRAAGAVSVVAATVAATPARAEGRDRRGAMSPG